ncbi:MAG: pseudouridine-5-phosphate glycosidase [Caldiserica bacterium CG02_land_8_20_14_3_00_36_38]|nr:pseudouridine-5'-phosphate glycosidase [Caldisericota bacterium]OIP13438.1 MAG: pseudouridine-5-phosphate glycosidase [Caldisericum sp. CG2_30_36_11]PIV56209.1 MAG: pseudouridine-5-phosphate glycosidase [Caldiserica bacterium CG02_land_8_20_14_3_00_36_38]PIX28954.1 MAG: pseudouridine-5-phosphate glycosidase [Caldiserica bacterium CG_4_8_14_3_um_filter_35_18]
MRISEEVKEALKTKVPVVALESTIISHGMPYPKNIEVAIEVEQVVRKEGGIPATIGVIKGEIVVGLSKSEIKYIGSAKEVMKLSTREIPICIMRKKDGATTVSATSFIAERAGIKVFATGGVGGVHRDVFESLDISRDLEELSERSIIIVSSGVKSILDISKTIEYLETKGVLVVGYKTDEFPAFYSRKSNIKIPKINSPEAVAKIFKEKQNLLIKGGILVANPVPEEYEIPSPIVEKWIALALADARRQDIHGKQVTPFLLSKLVELSNGKTLTANVHLIKNNAKVAALIARELAK